MDDIRETLRLKSGLRHRDVVTFEGVLFRDTSKLILSARQSSLAADLYTRAAIEAGWLEAPDNETGQFGNEKRHFIAGVDVNDLEAWQVRYIGKAVEQLYSELVSVPKN